MSAIAEDGVVGVAPHSPDLPDAAFWAMCAGFVVIILGSVVHRGESRGSSPSVRSTGQSITALGAAGATVNRTLQMWAAVALGVLATRRAARPASGRPVVGRLLVGVALLNTAVIVATHGDGVAEVVSDGIIRAAPDAPGDPGAAF